MTRLLSQCDECEELCSIDESIECSKCDKYLCNKCQSTHVDPPPPPP